MRSKVWGPGDGKFCPLFAAHVIGEQSVAVRRVLVGSIWVLIIISQMQPCRSEGSCGLGIICFGMRFGCTIKGYAETPFYLCNQGVNPWVLARHCTPLLDQNYAKHGDAASSPYPMPNRGNIAAKTIANFYCVLIPKLCTCLRTKPVRASELGYPRHCTQHKIVIIVKQGSRFHNSQVFSRMTPFVAKTIWPLFGKSRGNSSVGACVCGAGPGRPEV